LITTSSGLLTLVRNAGRARPQPRPDLRTEQASLPSGLRYHAADARRGSRSGAPGQTRLDKHGTIRS